MNFTAKRICCTSVITAVCCMILLLVSSVLLGENVYGASKITDANIKEGLEFCQEYPISLSLNGEKIGFDAKDVPPVIITPVGETEGRTLIPARTLFEKMGASVDWNDSTQTVTISLADQTIALVIGSQTATVNGVKQALDVPALIIDHDGDYFGSTMIPVRFVAEALNCQVIWDGEDRHIMVGYSLGADGKVIPASQSLNSLFPEYDMSTLPAFTSEAATKLIAIDSGHGGRDSGAVGHKGKADQLYEKDLNFPIAQRVRDYLEAAGGSVYLIQEEDSYISTYDRPVMANEKEADFFVSIHNNSENGHKQSGTMVLYADKLYYGLNEYGRAICTSAKAIEWATSNPAIIFDENGEPVGTSELDGYGITSGEVAENVLAEMMAALGTRKAGLKDDIRYIVLNCSKMPAIIIEGAFLSNESDLAKMREPEYIERYAYATAKALIESFNARFPN